MKAEGERARDTIGEMEETIRLLRLELEKEKDEKEKIKEERDVVKKQSKQVRPFTPCHTLLLPTIYIASFLRRPLNHFRKISRR